MQVVESGAKNIEIAVLKRGSHTETLPDEVIEGVVKEIEKAREEDLGEEDEEEKQADENED